MLALRWACSAVALTPSFAKVKQSGRPDPMPKGCAGLSIVAFPHASIEVNDRGESRGPKRGSALSNLLAGNAVDHIQR